MNFSRSLRIPAILILGANIAAGPILAQSSSGTPASSAEPAPLQGKVVEDIVAKVNDQIITQSDYQRAQQQMEAETKQQNLSSRDLEDRDQDLLRDLIDQQLLLSKGKELGITGETELIRRLDEIRKQNHLGSLDDLEKAAQAQGVSYEDFKASIRNSIITQQVVRDEVSQHVSMSMSQADVRNYFKAHESEFAQPESVHLSEILIPTPAGGEADAAQVSAAQAKAGEIEAKLRAGAKFEELAKTASSGPTAAQGGDLGEFRRGALAPLLEQKTFSLQPGQFTEPIRTKQGFVILKVTQHNPGGEAGFQAVEPQVQEALFMERMQPALRQYLTKLREEAYIEIKPGFVDTGASPNEIHPTESAYVPPGPKKKKKFQRTRFRGRVRSRNKQQIASGASSSATAAGNTAPGKTQVAEQNARNVQKAGRKEKIRFGQAPRESLPPAQNNPAAAGGSSQVASVTNPNNANAENDIAVESPARVKPVKTRFSARPRVHKTKKAKAAAVEANQPPPPTPEEVATQKVQSAPLGLAGQPEKKKKKKGKGEKTRYSARPKQPEQTPQPYMGNQSQPAGSQPQGATSQPKADGSPAAPNTSGGNPQ